MRFSNNLSTRRDKNLFLRKSLLLAAAVAVSMGAYSVFGIISSSFAGDRRLPDVSDLEDSIVWIRSYARALDEAKRTGKPIFLEFRCAP